MTDKSKKNEGPQRSKSGWKIYFDGEEEEYLRRKAREEGYKTPQERLRHKVRIERLNDKKK